LTRNQLAGSVLQCGQQLLSERCTSSPGQQPSDSQPMLGCYAPQRHSRHSTSPIGKKNRKLSIPRFEHWGSLLKKIELEILPLRHAGLGLTTIRPALLLSGLDPQLTTPDGFQMCIITRAPIYALGRGKRKRSFWSTGPRQPECRSKL